MTQRRGARIAILAVVALGAAAAGFALAPRGGPPAAISAPPTTAQGAELEALRRSVARLEVELELAHARREEIAGELARLEARLGAATLPGGAVAAAPDSQSGPPARSGRGDPLFDEAALVRAGLDPGDVETLRSRLDAARLDGLYLRDQAAREGWLDTPRYFRERQTLADGLSRTRDEFGDEFYDWAIYSAGRPNRVVVSSVMDGSAAAEAGLAPGDVILRYADSRIFDAPDLRSQTAEGTAGEQTAVEVLRDGEPIQVYMPRGPLGITVEPSRQEPAPTG